MKFLGGGNFPLSCLDETLHDSVSLIIPDRFFQVVGEDGRRGHCFKLFKRRYRLDVGRFKFASRVSDKWNRLDGDIVAVESVNGFKRKLDHHLRNVRGYF